MKKLLPILIIALFAFAKLNYAMVSPTAAKELLEATQRNDAATVKTLLENNPLLMVALPVIGDVNGNNPLIIAVNHGNTSMIKILLERNPTAADWGNNQGQTALTFAINKSLDIVKLVLNNSAIDIDKQDNDGNTPLMYAVKTKNVDIVKAIIGEVPNPDIKNNDGKTALDIAGTTKDMPQDMVKLLASASVRDQYRLYKAIAEKKNFEEIKKLVTPNITFNLTTPRNPLIAAVDEDNVQLIQFLLEQGADINFSLPDGLTPLMLAASHGNKDSIEKLLALGADPSLKNAQGQTALDLFKLLTQTSIFKLLEATGEIDVNTQEIIQLLEKAPIPSKKPTPEPTKSLLSELHNLTQKLKGLQQALKKK